MKNSLKSILISLLGFSARVTVRKFKPTVIAVTGSVGKTSSKEAIFAVLKNSKRVRKSSGNFNSEMGVPLTILGDFGEKDLNLFSREMPPGANRLKKIIFLTRVILSASIRFLDPLKSVYQYPEVLVLEYGADKPGDIDKLVEIAKPSIAVVSAVGKIPVHVENYPGGVESVAEEKGGLICDLGKGDTAVLNYDDKTIGDLIKYKTGAKTIGFGFSKNADVMISDFKHVVHGEKIEGIEFYLKSYCSSHLTIVKQFEHGDFRGEKESEKTEEKRDEEKEKESAEILVNGVFSVSHAYAAACAVAVASVFKISLSNAANDLMAYYKPVKGRSVVLDGVKGTQIIDESYNSSPVALETALVTMKMVTHARKIAVLGDMTELGKYSLKAHQMVGDIVGDCIDFLITVGPRAKFIAQRALEKGMSQSTVFMFDNLKDAGSKLQAIMQKGDVVLIKGSRVVGLDKIVEEIKNVV